MFCCTSHHKYLTPILFYEENLKKVCGGRYGVATTTYGFPVWGKPCISLDFCMHSHLLYIVSACFQT